MVCLPQFLPFSDLTQGEERNAWKSHILMLDENSGATQVGLTTVIDEPADITRSTRVDKSDPVFLQRIQTKKPT